MLGYRRGRNPHEAIDFVPQQITAYVGGTDYCICWWYRELVAVLDLPNGHFFLITVIIRNVSDT